VVPPGLGLRQGGLADLSARPPRKPRLDRGALRPARPPSKDVAAYVAKRLSSAPNRYEARVTIHASAEAIREHAPSAWGTIEPIDNRSCEYRSGDDDLGWLALRVAMLGVDFDVHEPPELVEHLRVLGRRLGRAASVE